MKKLFNEMFEKFKKNRKIVQENFEKYFKIFNKKVQLSHKQQL